MTFPVSARLPAELERLKQEFDFSYAQTPVSNMTLVNDLCWLRTHEGAVRHGQEVLFPYAPWSGRAEKKSPFQKLRSEFQEAISLSLRHYTRGPETGRIIDIGTKISQLGELVSQGIDEMMPSVQCEYDFDLADLIGNGTSAINIYDGRAHFATNHLANPAKPSLGTFSNYDAALSLDRPGIIKVLDAMNRRPWFDGRVRDYMGSYTLLVSNEDQYQRAAEVLQTSIRAGTESSTGGVASTDNSRMMQGRASVRLMKQLADKYSNKAWVMLLTVTPTVRPFVLSIVQPPYLKFEGEIPSDHLSVVQGACQYSWEAVWGMGYADPRYSHLCIEP